MREITCDFCGNRIGGAEVYATITTRTEFTPGWMGEVNEIRGQDPPVKVACGPCRYEVEKTLRGLSISKRPKW